MPTVGATSSAPIAHIDLRALIHNYRQVRVLVGADVAVLAMVKADAYGHGLERVGAALAGAGCSRFGVATVSEGIFLRACVGPEPQIAVFGGIVPSDAIACVDASLEVVTQEAEVVDALGAAAVAVGRESRIHIKVDTGMSRLGVRPEQVVEFAGHIRSVSGAEAVGVCSMLACADAPEGELTAAQCSQLAAASAALSSAGFDLERHLANSAAVLTGSATHFDLVRPGLMLYGLYPSQLMRERADLRPVMRLDAAVVRVAAMGAGRGVGYGHTYQTSAPTRLATLRVGYGDGYPRAASNVCEVSAGSGSAAVRAAVVGRVCMDHTIIDATAMPALEVGDRVTLWGPELGAEEVAERCGTISYELMARVGARVPRRYTD